MNEYKTLQELCKMVGVSRRAVQGYEKAGLVTPTDRNKYGHLLYGIDEQRRIAKIKLLQDLHFSIKEITILIDAPDSDLKEALINQLTRLYEEKAKLENMIATVEKLIRKGES